MSGEKKSRLFQILNADLEIGLGEILTISVKNTHKFLFNIRVNGTGRTVMLGEIIIKYPSSVGFAGWNTKTENEIRVRLGGEIRNTSVNMYTLIFVFCCSNLDELGVEGVEIFIATCFINRIINIA